MIQSRASRRELKEARARVEDDIDTLEKRMDSLQQGIEQRHTENRSDMREMRAFMQENFNTLARELRQLAARVTNHNNGK